MNRKTNKFNVLTFILLLVLLGFTYPTVSTKMEPQQVERSKMGAHVSSLLERESFILTGEERAKFASYLVDLAKDHEFDPLLILAIMKIESSFRHDAVSFAGAYGLLQVKPIASLEVSQVFNMEAYDGEGLLNPYINVHVGVLYLSYLRDVIGRDPVRMLSAYNLGPTTVRRSRRHSRKYANKVLAAYQYFLKEYS